jgi:hypothetical protein
MFGINPTQADTAQKFALGTESVDPRSIDFPQNRIRYVRATGTIAANRAVTQSADNTSEPHAVVATTATGQSLTGVTLAALDSQTNLFGWITIKGHHPSVLSGGTWAQGNVLSPCATAGALIALVTADSADAAIIAAIGGVKISAVDTASAAGSADVLIY